MHFLSNFRQKGFTIIEFVFAIALLATVLFVMMILFDKIRVAAFEEGRSVSAGFLARERLEEIILDKASPDRGYAWVNNFNYAPNESVIIGNNMFSRTLNIYEVEVKDLMTPKEKSGFKRIDLTVGWGTAADQKITLSTLITEY